MALGGRDNTAGLWEWKIPADLLVKPSVAAYLKCPDSDFGPLRARAPAEGLLPPALSAPGAPKAPASPLTGRPHLHDLKVAHLLAHALQLPLVLIQGWDHDLRTSGELYRALTMLAQRRVMKTRHNMSIVIEGLQKDHGLLAAYLEATDKIGWRALQEPVVIAETPKPVNVEATSILPRPSPFVLRRTNLVQVP